MTGRRDQLALMLSLCVLISTDGGRVVAQAHPVSEPAAQAPAKHHCAQGQPPAAAAPLPGRSLYHSTVSLTDQHGTLLHARDFRGQVVIMTMFYASCTTVCPMLIGQLQRIDAALSKEARARTRILLVSLDPQRDTPERLAELAKRYDVDDRWSFTRANSAGVQEIAALLGVTYRRTASGDIDHAAVIALLDRDGVVVEQIEGSFTDVTPIVSKISKL